MTNKLKNYFPMIQERQEILARIRADRSLHARFRSWPAAQQEEFLDICTGVKGLKLLYDGFFKEVMNPEYVPSRLNDFLSHMLGQEVRILKVLPNDSTRLADESSLLIMDIVVELEDRSIANVEMQKIGYLFPGQRSACYSADLLLRQYRRVRGERKDNFNYHDIKNVYTIVLFEKSPKEFHAYPHEYYHFFEQKSNTGLKMELLQKYLFIPLDIFRKSQHNRTINNKKDAWLTLFSCDDPDTVAELIRAYPEFMGIYEEAYTICLNIERVMEMFSEELAILDRNTAKYMMDEMQNEIDAMHDRLKEQKKEFDEQQSKLEEQRSELTQQRSKLVQQQSKLNQQQSKLDQQQSKLDQQQYTIDKQQYTIDQMKERYDESLRNAIALLRSLEIPDSEIVVRICEQYQMDESQLQQYF